MKRACSRLQNALSGVKIEYYKIFQDFHEHPKQVAILHSALKQQRDQNQKTLADQEKMFNEERKRLNDNFSQQHERQLNFIDQLIKDKQGLADQVTSLVRKIEQDETTRSKEKNELTEKHKGLKCLVSLYSGGPFFCRGPFLHDFRRF